MKLGALGVAGIGVLFSAMLLGACGGSTSDKKAATPPAAPSGPPALAPNAPVTGSVGYGASNTYVIATTPGTAYTVTLTGMGPVEDADLSVSQDNISPAPCTIDNTQLIASFPEDCTITAAGNTLYVKVIGYSSASYTVYSTLAPFSGGGNEGTFAIPLPIGTGSPRVSQVAAFGDSFYSVSVNGTVTLTLSGIANPLADVDLLVFTDSGFTTAAPCNPNDTVLLSVQPESCKVTWTGTLYILAPEFNFAATQFLLLVK